MDISCLFMTCGGTLCDSHPFRLGEDIGLVLAVVISLISLCKVSMLNLY